MSSHDIQDLIGVRDDGHSAPGARRSLTVFVVCLSVAVLLVLGGRVILQARAGMNSGLVPAPPISVSVLPVSVQAGFEQTSRHVGLVEPKRKTDLAFEASGTLIEVMVEEGDRVNLGDAVARLDTRTLQASRTAQLALRDALLSDLERAQLTLQRQQLLEARKLTADQALDDARLSVDRAEAMIKQADAAVQSIDVALDKAVLRAPFDAEVGRQSVDEGSTVNAGMSVASLFEWNAPTVRIGLPVDIARTLSVNSVHSVVIDDISYPAVLLSRRHDVASRTRTLDVRFDLLLADRVSPAFGQTAQLQLRQYVEARGYRVPITALSEGESGLWSVLLAIPDEPGSDVGRVVREHVDIVHTDGEYAYVSGNLSADAALIQSGLHRVAAGQRVHSVVE